MMRLMDGASTTRPCISDARSCDSTSAALKRYYETNPRSPLLPTKQFQEVAKTNPRLAKTNPNLAKTNPAQDASPKHSTRKCHQSGNRRFRSVTTTAQVTEIKSLAHKSQIRFEVSHPAVPEPSFMALKILDNVTRIFYD